MDAFEMVRRAASALHDRAVAAGADPWKPLSLAETAAVLEEIDLSWAGPGDPILKGGRALFEPVMRMVICEDAGSQADRALLAAHEIGHAVVHKPVEEMITHTIDPGRLAETAATGVERVVDYGRRERRELQADLFAREFVLPRSRARRLHLEEGMGAAVIASGAGLPYPLVAQQLLDACLLPEPGPEAAPSDKPAVGLDMGQARAASQRGRPFQLQAGPGTGKTRTLVHRLDGLIDEPVDPASILVLTFSNKAAGELVERLARSRPLEASKVWIGTFHAFGLDVLRRFHDQAKLPSDPRLIDRADAIGLLEELVPALPLRHYRNLYDPTTDLGDMLSAISRAKDEVVTPDAYRALAERMAVRAEERADPDAAVRAAKALEVAAVYEVYERELRKAGLLDFGDLVSLPVRLAETNAEVAAALRDRHGHILVDEYQDVNRASVRLLKVLAGEGKRLWVVGDSRQSIYRFRGASSANMALFGKDFPKAESDQLRINYRSSQEIVDTFVSFAETMAASGGVEPLDLKADQGLSGHKPELRLVDHPEDEAAAIAARILELREKGIPYRDQAVLCRGNARLATNAAALEARGIPVLFLGNLFQREEIRDLLALLSLVVDPKAGGLPRVACQERYALSLQTVARLHEILAAAEVPLEPLAAVTSEAFPSSDHDGLERLRQDLAEVPSTCHPWSFLTALLLDKGDAVRHLAGSAQPADRLKAMAIWQFLAFCRSLPDGPGQSIQRLLDRVRRLCLLAEERDLRQVPAAASGMDAVRLLTVHGSKGLEFEAVHVPGMTAASFPLGNRPPRCLPPDGMIAGSEGLTGLEAVTQGQDEEEECLFFVAMSRARRHLALYASTRQANGHSRSASPYLDRIAPIVDRIDRPALHQPTRKPAETIAVTWVARPRFSQEQFALFARCPRRFFYTHVLNVAGGRRVTPFTSMHDVLYGMIRWLGEDHARWNLPLADVEPAFDVLWRDKGPVGHGYEPDYRRSALGMIAHLIQTRRGAPHVQVETVELPVGGATLVVRPDELRRSGNQVVLRRVRTGRKTSDEFDDIVYGLYHMAAVERYGAGAGVEAIHLTGETQETVPITPQKLANRRKKAGEFVADILAGSFPAKPNERTCPRCPHFFTCEAVPVGELVKDLSADPFRIKLDRSIDPVSD